MNGWIIITRNRETKGVYVEVTEDWREILGEDCRLIFCQAVSDVETVGQKVDQLLQEGSYHNDTGDVNDTIAELISSVQWIANEHSLRSFRSLQTI